MGVYYAGLYSYLLKIPSSEGSLGSTMYAHLTNDTASFLHKVWFEAIMPRLSPKKSLKVLSGGFALDIIAVIFAFLPMLVTVSGL